jgi:hypothetical protein
MRLMLANTLKLSTVAPRVPYHVKRFDACASTTLLRGT